MKYRNVILCISKTIGFQKQLSFAHDFSKCLQIQEQIEPKSIIKRNLIYSSNILLCTRFSLINVYVKPRWDQGVRSMQMVVSLISSKHLYVKCFKTNTEFLFMLPVIFFFSFLILKLSKVKLLLISNAYIVSVKRPHFYSLLVTNYLLLFTFNFVVFYILLITCYFLFRYLLLSTRYALQAGSCEFDLTLRHSYYDI